MDSLIVIDTQSSWKVTPINLIYSGVLTCPQVYPQWNCSRSNIVLDEVHADPGAGVHIFAFLVDLTVRSAITS